MNQANSQALTLTVKQAAELLQLSEDLVYNLVHRQDFPSFRIGRKILIDRQRLETWVSQQNEMEV